MLVAAILESLFYKDMSASKHHLGVFLQPISTRGSPAQQPINNNPRTSRQAASHVETKAQLAVCSGPDSPTSGPEQGLPGPEASCARRQHCPPATGRPRWGQLVQPTVLRISPMYYSAYNSQPTTEGPCSPWRGYSQSKQLCWPEGSALPGTQRHLLHKATSTKLGNMSILPNEQQ